MTAALSAVSAEQQADCPFSVALDDASAFLRAAQANGGRDADIRVPAGFLPALLRHRVAMDVALQFDGSERGRGHDEIHLRWKAATRWLPDFSGTVRFRIEGLGTRVRVDGVYRVPFGAFGQLFDALAGARIAQRSVAALAQRLATYLEDHQRTWRAGVLEDLAAEEFRISG